MFICVALGRVQCYLHCRKSLPSGNALYTISGRQFKPRSVLRHAFKPALNDFSSRGNFAVAFVSAEALERPFGCAVGDLA